MIKNDNFNIIG